MFGVKVHFLQSARAKVLKTSVLFDCLLGKFIKHNKASNIPVSTIINGLPGVARDDSNKVLKSK